MQRNALAAAASAAIVSVFTMQAPMAHASLLNAANWWASGPGAVSVTNIQGGVDFSYDYSPGYCAGCGGHSWIFYTAATSTGVFGFDWTQTANYGWYQPSGRLTITDETTGVSKVLNTSSGTVLSGALTGTADLTVNAGDTIALQATASNGDSQGFIDGDVQLVGLPLPEPTTLALFGAGLAGLYFVRRRSVRRASRII